MPTNSSAPLMNLVEHRARDSFVKRFGGGELNRDSENGAPSVRHLYISPSLYTTPKQAPVPESFSSERAFDSPYVVNHKPRRGSGVDPSQVPDLGEEEVVNDFGNGDFDGEVDDFRSIDTRSEASALGASDSLSFRQIDSSSGIGEFIDANEDLSEDGSGSNSPFRNYKLEELLHATRLNLVEEIARRKAAEESVILMQSQWEKILSLFSETGLTFLAPPTSIEMELDDDSYIHQLLQELVVSKCVAEAIAGELARAEAEEVFFAIIKSKDQEIQRLHDRLQYYETVNHELSQRTLVEVARRQQQKKKNRRRWMWSLMGLSIAALGASFVAYEYASNANGSSSSGNDVVFTEQQQ